MQDIYDLLSIIYDQKSDKNLKKQKGPFANIWTSIFFIENEAQTDEPMDVGGRRTNGRTNKQTKVNERIYDIMIFQTSYRQWGQQKERMIKLM